MSAMRAKVKVNSCDLQSPTQERVTFVAVAADKYPADGKDENNSYARWSPSATFSITICNPDLIGKYQPGAEYYVDFTPAG